MGDSQGGPIAVAYAAANPDNVSHLILYGSYHDGTTAYFRDLIDGFVALIRADWGGSGRPQRWRCSSPACPRKSAPLSPISSVRRRPPRGDRDPPEPFDFKVTNLRPEVNADPGAPPPGR